MTSSRKPRRQWVVRQIQSARQNRNISLLQISAEYINWNEEWEQRKEEREWVKSEWEISKYLLCSKSGFRADKDRENSRMRKNLNYVPKTKCKTSDEIYVALEI